MLVLTCHRHGTLLLVFVPKGGDCVAVMPLLKGLVLYVLSLTVSGEYFYVPLKMTYMKALTVCTDNGLQLVDMKTNETQDLVSAYMNNRKNDIWTGLHYNASLNQLQWGDGEILDPPGSLPWQDGQPVVSLDTGCVVMNLDGGSVIFRSATCHLNNTFLCMGQETLNLPRAWPSIVRYTKRNSTERGLSEPIRADHPVLVFERRGISGQLLSSKLVHDVEDCALSCMGDENCIYFIFIYRGKFKGLCLIHIPIPG
ncbi:uncharacterized protein [Haliotis asinina]|uniref:uncharacterized protein n=1 Tax=Haliotis asinina TaxID=109174 RepID=UPI0035326907